MNPKIRNFASLIEPEAMEQVERTASMPFVRSVAVMPDVHFGKGSTVGTVVATRGAIIPACVGVDIGCGMIAVRTNIKASALLPKLHAVRVGIERRIPLGIGPYGQNSRIIANSTAEGHIAALEMLAYQKWNTVDHMDKRYPQWRQQIGSLGGGNHFIEVCVGRPVSHQVHEGQLWETEASAGKDDEVWVILHSGSRGVGNKTGTFWTKAAQQQAKKYMYDGWLPDPDLAYLVEHSEEFWEYMKELYWCQEFARRNRDEMMERVLEELWRTVVDGSWGANLELERINCHHNYVEWEHHNGENVLVTRKGAILASEGTRGLIPGSMGTASYIVTGLGNAGALNSAPHGAGRKMSRNEARKQFTVESVQQEMEAQGIEARIRKEIVDEAPGAYKDIDVVMRDAQYLVRPTNVLRQLISVKGD